jgi:membrane associated rhomboid family serine protease
MIPIHDSQKSYSTPFVTIALIALNVWVFLYQFSLDSFTRNEFVFHYGFVAEHFRALALLTSIFLHGGWLHLGGNMLFLWVYGDNVEDILGHWQYLLFYLACGLAAGLGQYAIAPDSRVPLIGASGAIAGVMGAYMVKFPHARIVLVGWFVILFTVELPAYVVLLYWLALQFFSGVGSVSDVYAQRGGTAFFAHIGGFIAGIALIFLFKTRDRHRRRRDLLW